jgi:hypothetical protein
MPTSKLVVVLQLGGLKLRADNQLGPVYSETEGFSSVLRPEFDKVIYEAIHKKAPAGEAPSRLPLGTALGQAIFGRK